MPKNFQPDDNKTIPCPHDLLWITRLDKLIADQPLPPWVSAEWLTKAPVVIRREKVENPHHLPVGLRGKTRSDRFKALLPTDAITQSVSPESLVQTQAWNIHPQWSIFPAIKALSTIAADLSATGLCWGPTGSTGFALASGLPVIRAESDLDLLVRASIPLSADQYAALKAIRASSLCHIDIQIDTGYGGFAFAEWESGRKTVLLKTDTGPILTADPWADIHKSSTL
ncbi:malonate decarboxylase holo-ACP synthase [Glaciimonas sp. GG7]